MKFSSDISCLTPEPGQYFFGYYDICPWDREGKSILALKTNFLDHIPEKNEEAQILEIGLNQKPKIIGSTSSWNWQLGARLQWLPARPGKKIIYNTSQGGEIASEILDPETLQTRRLPLPIFALTPDGKYSLTLNFQHLREKRRSYGYPGKFQDSGKGIFRINIKTGDYREIIRLQQLQQYNPVSSLKPGEDWINHILISPTGKHFCFLHRWRLPGGGVYSRLFAAASDGSNLVCLHDSGMVTHCGWRTDEELAGWARKTGGTSHLKKNRVIISLLGRFLPLYRRFFSRYRQLHRAVTRDGYLIWRYPTGLTGEIGAGKFPGDGHCSFSDDGKLMLTDTYPDLEHRRHLYLYDLEAEELSHLAALNSLPSARPGLDDTWDQSGSRCDLHPRWDRKGLRFCFDSVHQGDRKIYQGQLTPRDY